MTVIEAARFQEMNVTFLDEMDPATGWIDATQLRDKGMELQAAYRAAKPFPHVVIDDFMPAALLEQCLSAFPDAGRAAEEYDRQQERFKRSFNPDGLAPVLRGLFYSFNSRPFVQVLENITGIKGLIPDPHFLGGGFHEISQGGHLSVHADFNHHRAMNLERRINVLIYLNHDWKPEFGGQLELWNDAMTQCEASLVPAFNRCVIFNTTSRSNHGNPQPVSHPDRMPRRSIALYYYTATWGLDKAGHTTKFRARPNTADRIEWKDRAKDLAIDCVPPLLMRGLRGLKRRA